MSLGFDAISALPFATSTAEGNVSVVVTGNALNITIGSVGIIADAVTEEADPNQVSLGLGTLSITTDVDHTLTGSQVTLNTGNVTVNIDIDVLPSGVDLTLATGNVTVTTDVNFTLDPNALTLNTVEPGVITWNNIVPGANMVWTPIKPY
mgnify:FL=1